MGQQQNPQKNQGNQRNPNHENKSMDEEEMIEVENQEKQKGDPMFEINGDEDEQKSSRKSQKMSVESQKGQFHNLSQDNYEKKELQLNNEMFMYPESSSSESSQLLNQTQILQQHLEMKQQNVNNVTQEENHHGGRDYSHLDRCRCRTQNQPCSNRNFCACIFNRRRCTSLCSCQLFECTNPNEEMVQQTIAIIQDAQRRQNQRYLEEIGIEQGQGLQFVEFDFFWMNPQFHEEERQKEKDEGTEDKMQEQQDEQKSEKKKKQSKKSNNKK